MIDTCFLEMRLHDPAYLLQFIRTHGVNLSDTEHCIVDCKLFKIEETDFFRTLSFQITSGIEHLLSQTFNLHTCDLGKLSRCILIQRRAGRRTEHQRIRNNRRTEERRIDLIRFHSRLLIHLIYNRSSTSHRLIPEKHRSHRLNTAQSVMIDDLQYFSFFHSVNCLIFFIVINKDHLFLPHIQKPPSGNQSEEFSFIVYDREIAESFACHNLFYVIHIIPQFKCNQIIL